MSTGFLITSLTTQLKRLNDIINQQVLKKLYIYVAVKKNQPNIRNNEWISKKIFDMYSTSSCLFPNLDVRIILNDLKQQGDSNYKLKDFKIDIFIVPKNFEDKHIFEFQSSNEDLSVVYCDELVDEEDGIVFLPGKMHEHVVLGGTFDRLHTGHKILLSEALLRCSKKLTVGVTDENMIRGKTLWELIEPTHVRTEAVKEFIREVDFHVDYEVVLISDPYGPTKSDPNMQMIVVSSETQKGAIKINELRKEKNLPILDVHVIELAEDCSSSLSEEKKISSSNSRLRLLGTYIKTPTPKADLRSGPYLIGLTGGITSGKSSIRKYLASKGCGTIDCDKVAHELYKPHTEIYNKLIELFGNKIVSENGKINRKELGAIVFNDYNKLQQLNNLMWPSILTASLEKANKMFREEHKCVVVLEAAILLKAGWQNNVDEVWSVIIPREEAIKRLKERNFLSQQDAEARINNQPTNSELIEISNVVFCSFWTYEFTRKQVDKAWRVVQNKLNLSESKKN